MDDSIGILRQMLAGHAKNAELAEATGSNEAAWHRNRCRALQAAITSLESATGQTSDARDAARLDWLEKRGCWRFSGPCETDIRGPAYRWFDYDTEGSDYSTTLREAIDAAMRQEAE